MTLIITSRDSPVTELWSYNLNNSEGATLSVIDVLKRVNNIQIPSTIVNLSCDSDRHPKILKRLKLHYPAPAPLLPNLGAAGCVCAIDTDQEVPVFAASNRMFPRVWRTWIWYHSNKLVTKKRMPLTACRNSILFDFCDSLKMAIFGSRMGISR